MTNGENKEATPTIKDAPKEAEVVPAPSAPVVPGGVKSLFFQAKKVFVGYEKGDNPELEPLFANHFEMFVIGGDVFLDVGIIKPEELAKLPEIVKGEPPAVVPFYVLYRIAMSYPTLERLQVKVNEIINNLKRIQESAGSTSIQPKLY
jgi:hypothetical protein